MNTEAEMHHPGFWSRDRLIAAVERLENELACARGANDEQQQLILNLKQQRMHLIEERDRWRFQAEQKMAMRREIEEILGVPSAPASDEQLKAGLVALRELKRDAESWRNHCKF